MSESELASTLEQEFLAHGFEAVGLVDFDRALPRYQEHLSRYRQWIDNGFQASMGYLERGLDRRVDPRLVFPEVRSVVCVLRAYPRAAAGEPDPARGARYARYLTQGDYHRDLGSSMESALRRARAACGSEDLTWKVCVDTSAVLERAWAEITGLGWIGKNTLLIHPRLGSYTFIGVAFLSHPLGFGPKTQPNLCGHCELCLKQCPTDAFDRPGVLNAKKCISYLTLEKRGPFLPEEAARVGAASYVAGCDICQEACPFNLKPSRQEASVGVLGGVTRRALWTELQEESETEYRLRVQNSALKRVKPADFKRNVQTAYSANRKP